MTKELRFLQWYKMTFGSCKATKNISNFILESSIIHDGIIEQPAASRNITKGSMVDLGDYSSQISEEEPFVA